MGLAEASQPDLALDGAGNAMAVWQEFGGLRMQIRANRKQNGEAWGTVEKVETTDLGDGKDPRIALDSRGNAMAVWSHYNGIYFDIRATGKLSCSSRGTG